MESNKTLLANPIFVNPKAYEVFPRITGYITQDNESTKEPARFNGTIEVVSLTKDRLVQTFVNTDAIDLDLFSEDTIRINLITKSGSCVLGEWKLGSFNKEPEQIVFNPQITSYAPVTLFDAQSSDIPQSVIEETSIGVSFFNADTGKSVFLGDVISSDSIIRGMILRSSKYQYIEMIASNVEEVTDISWGNGDTYLATLRIRETFNPYPGLVMQIVDIYKKNNETDEYEYANFNNVKLINIEKQSAS